MWETEDTPEAKLWREVLLTYFTDGAVLNHKFRRYLMEEARSPWTQMLCDMAGIDHGFFMRKLIEYFRKNRPKRSKIVFLRLDERDLRRCK